MKRIFYFLLTLSALVACEDDDDFSSAGGMMLTFGTDTLKMDTVFSRSSSSTYSFWVHNHNIKGLRLSSVRLSKGNQTGFRVNVDGSYLDNSNGSLINDLEIRRKDSILVFVELTPSEAHQTEPRLVEDDLVFSLESGTVQKVNLRAWAWDAERWDHFTLQRDTTITSARPVIVYGPLTIANGVTLKLKNTTLYFHDQAGIDVHGTLVTDSCLLRGDRLDRMFSYLPYDRVSGQWDGIHLFETSTKNVLTDTEIRNSSEYAILCDSATFDTNELRLDLLRCIVHNGEGTGIYCRNANVRLQLCQISNMADECLAIEGGQVQIHRCTLAQFYPFDGDRGAALQFSNTLPLHNLLCDSSIFTGYENDVIMGIQTDTAHVFEYQFMHSLLRTPKIETADSVRFSDVIWESPKDSIQGTRHFRLIDEENFIYDFHLDSLSTAKGLGCYPF
jgi:hypothetical protein